MRLARLWLCALFALLPATAGLADGSPLAIQQVDSGRTPAGQPWFRIRFSEAYPPVDVEEWYAATTIETGRGRYQFSVRRRGVAWDRWFVDEHRAPAGAAIESALDDGSLLVVMPLRAGRRAKFVVQSAARMHGRVVTHSWGGPRSPKKVGGTIADPFLLFGPGVPPADVASEPTGPRPEVRVPSAGGDRSPLASAALGALLGAAGLVLLRPPSGLRRSQVGLILAIGPVAGWLLSLAIPIDPLAGAAVGLGSVVSLVVAWSISSATARSVGLSVRREPADGRAR